MLSKLPVWWCQALALAFLHLSRGRQKATLGSFSGAGFWTGWAWILLGFGCFGSVPNGGRSCHRSCHCSSIHSSIHYMVFARFFHAFEAACLVMSGRCVQKATLGSFSGDGLGRLGLNPAGVCHGFALLSPVWNRLFWQDAWRKWRLVLFSHVRRRRRSHYFRTHVVVPQVFPFGVLCLLCILPAAFADWTSAASTTWFLHGFFMLSKLPVWWCQALELAFLHLS